jgi:hypothetical protein
MARPTWPPLLALTITACVLGACGDQITSTPDANPTLPGSGSTAPTMVTSLLYAYSLQLPDGWLANASSEDEDSYESADGQITLTVGTGRPDPGQTVEDRVQINREQEFPGCPSDPSQDRPVEVGGEPGVLWTFQCGGVNGVAANTIHGGLGYRLTLKASRTTTAELESIMEELISRFRFSD